MFLHTLKTVTRLGRVCVCVCVCVCGGGGMKKENRSEGE